jgi:hypothetical protein
MSDNRLICAAPLDGFSNLVENSECVRLRHLPPCTTLLVRTMNSLYRVVITPGPDVYVHGGTSFPEETSAHIDGASIGGSCLRVDCICVGLLVEIRSGGRRIVTSPVLAITIVPATGSVAPRCDERTAYDYCATTVGGRQSLRASH